MRNAAHLLAKGRFEPKRLHGIPPLGSPEHEARRVAGGEGAIRINGRDIALANNSFVSVPRGVSHTLTHRGRRPLIMLVELSGEPCEMPK